MTARSIAYIIRILTSRKFDNNRKFLMIASVFIESDTPIASYMMQFYHFSQKYDVESMTSNKTSVTYTWRKV